MVAARSPRIMTVALSSADKAARVLWSGRASAIVIGLMGLGRLARWRVSSASAHSRAMANFAGVATGPASVRGGHDAGARPAPGDQDPERHDGGLSVSWSEASEICTMS